MRKAIVLDSNDIKKLLSEKYNVPESNVIKSQYSYTVILEEDKKEWCKERFSTVKEATKSCVFFKKLPLLFNFLTLILIYS